MTKNQSDPGTGANSAEQKLAELEAVYASARTLVAELIQSIEAGGEGVRDLPSSLATLHKIFVAVTEAENKFNEKYGTIERPGDIDFDALRLQIGRRLDRLRDGGGAEEVSG